eukprot:GGOE01046157.1.p1 GENE.GGOE01046157.1~~GGOE01046157.1.p1  ORF type:complete len:375 (-),score=18.14 GGOE01046157.1:58-1182(-)
MPWFFIVSWLFLILSKAPQSSTTPFDHLGWKCLNRSTQSLSLVYPHDAEEHFLHIHRVLGRWAFNNPPMAKTKYFAGPWLENVWIQDCLGRYNTSNEGVLRLRTLFGPFIPLLLNWGDMFFAGHKRFPMGFSGILKKLLRPTVPYVTVSHSTSGITGRCEIDLRQHPNILVLSAGGFGHIPVPLLHKPIPPNNGMPAARRKYLVTFLGSLEHGTVRQPMKDIVLQMGMKLGQSVVVRNYWHNWMVLARNSRFILAPRGTGRTSYRLFETLQMQHVPVYIYTDVPWLPYGDLILRFGFVTRIAELSQLLRRLSKMRPQNITRFEQEIAQHRATHFTVEGVVEHIRNFLLGTKHDLHCPGLPPDPLGNGPCRTTQL